MGAPDLAMPALAEFREFQRIFPAKVFTSPAERVKRTVGRSAITPYPPVRHRSLPPLSKSSIIVARLLPATKRPKVLKGVMPTVLKSYHIGSTSLAKKRQEPAHIHVETAENAAKFWLSPVELTNRRGTQFKRTSQSQGTGGRTRTLFLGEMAQTLPVLNPTTISPTAVLNVDVSCSDDALRVRLSDGK